MQKLIRRVDALETRSTPTHHSSYLMGRGLSGGRIHYPYPGQSLSQPGYRPQHHLHHHYQPRAQPPTQHPPSYSHVDEQLYQTKQWLKHRTMNLS